jgi:nitroimidazol reductase NimA-like FMN-containing flavoprotein (pyridoxamine 5'-phosphate oxidase superfamily)
MPPRGPIIDPVTLSATPRTQLRRKRERQADDRALLYAVLDEALVCHLGLVDDDGTPLVLPTMHARVGDVVYVHGSTGAASLAAERDVCLTVTLLDGLVLARSVFAHSANYRSAVVRGRARRVTDPDEQLAALRAVVEHLTPGQWDHARRPDRRETAATAVLALPLDEASVKVRQGPPGDPEAVSDGDPRWAGVVPVTTILGAPEPCPALPEGVVVPEHVRAWADGSTAAR